MGEKTFLKGIWPRRKHALVHQDALQSALDQLAIQQTLFNAYKDPTCMERSLELTAGALSAASAFLLVMDDDLVQDVFCWPEDERKRIPMITGVDLPATFPVLYQTMLQSGGLICDLSDKVREPSCPSETRFLQELDIHSLILVPVKNSNHHIKAYLGALNSTHLPKNSNFLNALAHDYMLALSSVESYHLVRRMGSTDALTGLKNRNSYQQYLSQCTSMEADCLACIYADVNGLHELNNHLGHSAGDQMLITVAYELTSCFDKEHIYRIGGDEFVVFQSEPEDRIQKRIADLIGKVNSMGYQISVGYAWQGANWKLEKLIHLAEKNMYREKHDYYKKRGDLNHTRGLNLKLEQILQEKEDADSFLSIISPYFMGVYVVNLITDHTRIIYQPSYFTELLKTTDYQFMDALRRYAESYVHAEDRANFLKLLNYDFISGALEDGNTLEHHYRKIDGDRLFLRICRSKEFHNGKKEAFWIFERYTSEPAPFAGQA